MAKILNDSLITAATHKLIELRKGFLINGQYYLKENMQPVPFNTITYNNTNFTSGAYFSLDRVIKYNDNNNNGAMNHNDKRICFDSEDDRISYVFIESSTFKWLCKFKEENNFCELLYTIQVGINAWYEKGVYIYERNDEIRLIFAGQGTNTYIKRYRKSDLYDLGTYNIETGNSNTTYSYDQCSLLRVDNGVFYYKSGYNINKVGFFNELTNAETPLNINSYDPCYGSSTEARNRFNFNNFYKESDEKISIIQLALASSSNGASVNFKHGNLLEYDFDTRSFSRKQLEITVEEDITNTYTSGVYIAGQKWSSDVWYKTINEKEYMILYLRNYYYYNNVSRAYFFEIKKEEIEEAEEEKLSLHLAKIQEFPIGQCGQILHYKDEEKLRFYGTRKSGDGSSIFTNLHCYELDEARLEFVKVFNLDGEMREFGFDVNKNLYVLWNNYEVSKYNERTAANFNARFENTMYEYEGEDIATKLIISTTNLEGDLIEKDVTLDLKGNVKFTSNGTKTITLKTSAEAETEVPITITGAGSLSIFPKVKL